MALRPTRRRVALWTLSLLLVSLLFLSLTVSPPTDRGLRWYESFFFSVLRPFHVGATTVRNKVIAVIHGYFYLVDVAGENRHLRTANQGLSEQLLLYRHFLEENARLRTLLEFQRALPWRSRPARVIGYSPQAEFQLLLIDHGAEHGISRRMPVVSAAGVVGQVYRVAPRTAQVLLLTDPTSAIDARAVLSEARGLVRGRVVGTEWDRAAHLTALEYVDRAVVVTEGELLLTSGLDGIFPEGFPIGTVHQAELDSQGLFQSAQVIPNVEPLALREVLVILSLP